MLYKRAVCAIKIWLINHNFYPLASRLVLSLKIKLQQIPCFHLLLQISVQTGKHMISTTQSQLNGYESHAMSLEFNCIKRCQKVFGQCLLNGILLSQALVQQVFTRRTSFLEFSKGDLILSNHCQVGIKSAQHLKFSSLLHKIISNIQNLETPTKLTRRWANLDYRAISTGILSFLCA